MRPALLVYLALCLPNNVRADDSAPAPPPVTSKVAFDLGEPVSGVQKILGKGTYVVQQGYSLVSMKIEVFPSQGELVQTEKATYKDGKWSATILRIAPGTYNVHMIMQIKNEVDRKITDIGSPFKRDLKVP